MREQHLPGLDVRGAATALADFDLGPLGTLRLDALRDVALRAGRLAGALLDCEEADVILVQQDRVWRGKGPRTYTDDVGAAALVRASQQAVWIADTRLDPSWRDHPVVQGPKGVRFCAMSPIRTRDGSHLGALRVFGEKATIFDPRRAAALDDLAALVADEADRLLGGDVRRMRDLFNQAPGFMAIAMGPDHVFELANDAYMTLVGKRRLLGLGLREAIPEVASQGFNELLDQVYGSGRPYVARAAEVHLRRGPEGALETVFVDFVCQPIREADDSISGVFMQGQDVTKEKLAADGLLATATELKAALSATQTIFDQSLDVICTMDAGGVFTKVSRHALATWGYRPEEMVGRHYTDFVASRRRAAQPGHRPPAQGGRRDHRLPQPLHPQGRHGRAGHVVVDLVGGPRHDLRGRPGHARA